MSRIVEGKAAWFQPLHDTAAYVRPVNEAATACPCWTPIDDATARDAGS